MKKRIFVALVCAMMVMALLPMPFFPVAAADGITLISNRAQLEAIKDDPAGNYRLTTDIDLAGKAWSPLPQFSGTLDGGDHIIRNLSITDTTGATGNYKGLFTSIANGSLVCNLGLEDVNITAGNYAGGIAGGNAGTIRRCYTKGTVSGEQYVGGVTGKNANTIENCYSRVAVSGTEYLGGLAGDNSGTIATSYAASQVTDSVMKNYLHFQGNGYVNISHVDQYKVDAFTLEAWFQWDPDSVDSDRIEFIIGKDFEHFEIHTGGAAGENGLRFIPIPEGGTSTTFDGYRGDSYIDVHDVLQAGWFHVAAVYSYVDSHKPNNVTVRVYVNGEPQNLYQISSSSETVGTTATLTRTSNPLRAETNALAFNIGRRSFSGNYYFNGKIADVRLWNCARTESQIKANKDRVLNGNEEHLIGYWKLDESDGAAIDSSETMNYGNLNGHVERITWPDSAAYNGGLTGRNVGLVSNCFYDSTLYGSASGGEGTGKPTADMKLRSTFTGWDFDTLWKIDAGDYPNLGFKTVTGVAVSPDAVRVAKGASQSFTATVTGTNDPAQTVTWSVEGKTSATTSISTGGVLSVGSDETAAALTVRATSTVDSTKSGTATVTVTPPAPTVTRVAVNPASVSVQKGGSQSFYATVDGNHGPAQTVTWSVEGKTSASTSISTGGVLSVGSDETSAALTVRATSTVDSTKSGTATVTVTAAPPTVYQMIRGQNGKWTKGSTTGLSFTADGEYRWFDGVLVDGTTVSSGNYTAASGSTIVTLKAAYLESLSTGQHTLRMNFEDGYAETHFTILAEAAVPETGDTAQPMLWLATALLAGALLTASTVRRRRRQNG